MDSIKQFKQKVRKLLRVQSKKCPKCKTTLSTDARICPECSHSFFEKPQNYFKTITLKHSSCCATPVLIALILAVLIYRVQLLRDFFMVIIIGFVVLVILVMLYVTGLIFEIKRMFGF